MSRQWEPSPGRGRGRFHGDNKGGRGGRGSGYGQRNRGRTTFTGNTKDMNGHVFQLHTEQQRRRQFQATLHQLQTFTALHHKKESKAMKVIFTNMEEPILPVPQLPAGKQPISKVEEALFAQETKQYA